MLLIPKSTFLLRVESHKRIIAHKGVKIEVSEGEAKRFHKKFVQEKKEQSDKPGLNANTLLKK